MDIKIERKNGYVTITVGDTEHDLGKAQIDRIEYRERIICLDLVYDVKGIKSLIHVVKRTGSIEQTLYY